MANPGRALSHYDDTSNINILEPDTLILRYSCSTLRLLGGAWYEQDADGLGLGYSSYYRYPDADDFDVHY